MKSTDLVGTWALEAFSAKGSDGTVARPFGDAPRGFVTYAAAGCMAAVLMRSGRTKFASGDAIGIGGTFEEVKEAFEGFEAYAGRYVFDEGTSVVTHYVEVARPPNLEGSALVRCALMVGATLELSTPEFAAMGQNWVFTFAWRRA